MNKIINRDEFVTELASRARFTKQDINLILDTMIEILIEAVKNNSIIFMRGFFKLYTQKIPARKGKGGIDLPPATRVICRLAENIRFANSDDKLLW
jgi:nucleoid DNA-binding protein